MHPDQRAAAVHGVACLSNGSMPQRRTHGRRSRRRASPGSVAAATGREASSASRNVRWPRHPQAHEECTSRRVELRRDSHGADSADPRQRPADRTLPFQDDSPASVAGRAASASGPSDQPRANRGAAATDGYDSATSSRGARPDTSRSSRPVSCRPRTPREACAASSRLSAPEDGDQDSRFDSSSSMALAAIRICRRDSADHAEACSRFARPPAAYAATEPAIRSKHV